VSATYCGICGEDVHTGFCEGVEVDQAATSVWAYCPTCGMAAQILPADKNKPCSDSDCSGKLISPILALGMEPIGGETLDSIMVLEITRAIPDGQNFTVTFRKKDDSIRVLEGVFRRNKAATLPSQDEPTDSLYVWDRKAESLKSFKVDRVLKISIP